MNFYLIRT